MGQLKDKALIRKVVARIKELRNEQGITQEVFTYDTNIHIARIETGNANISISTLSAICKYFKISLKDFFSKGFD